MLVADSVTAEAQIHTAFGQSEEETCQGTHMLRENIVRAAHIRIGYERLWLRIGMPVTGDELEEVDIGRITPVARS